MEVVSKILGAVDLIGFVDDPASPKRKRRSENGKGSTHNDSLPSIEDSSQLSLLLQILQVTDINRPATACMFVESACSSSLIVVALLQLLGDLMEGASNEIVQTRVLQCVRWDGYHRLLREMYDIKHIHGHVYSEAAQRAVDVVAIKMFSMVEKLFTSTVVDKKTMVENLSPILKDSTICAYFRKHCLSVEVVRKSGELECLFFPRPLLKITRNKSLQNRFKVIMDRCPRTDPQEKLQVLQELMMEMAKQISVAESSHKFGDDFRSKANATLSKISGLTQLPLNMLTIALNVLLVLAYVPGSCAFCSDSWESRRSHVLFLVLGPLHTVLCTVNFASWVVVRAPVLFFRINRSKHLTEVKENEMFAVAELDAEDEEEEALIDLDLGLEDSLLVVSETLTNNIATVISSVPIVGECAPG